jgi:LacI family transcriptional regulator
MAATIKDIARRLNVSVSTVSYALNDGPRDVSPETKARVLKAAAELDYRPNRIAKSLVTRTSFTLGVVPTERIPDLADMHYFHGCFNGIVNRAEQVDYDVLTVTRYSVSDGKAMVDALSDGRVDGLIFLAPRRDCEVVDAVMRRRIPTVLMSSCTKVGTATVGCDNEHGIRLAVEHLYRLGHRKIAHISGTDILDDAQSRLSAFHEAIAHVGLKIEDGWIRNGQFSPEGGMFAATQMLRLANRPTAIVCANDDSALGALWAARELGFSVPQQLSIVGFDDAAFSRHITPGITTVAQPLNAMGAAAVDLLLKQLDHKPVQHRRFLPELIVRASTSRPLEDIHS